MPTGYTKKNREVVQLISFPCSVAVLECAVQRGLMQSRFGNDNSLLKWPVLWCRGEGTDPPALPTPQPAPPSLSGSEENPPAPSLKTTTLQQQDLVPQFALEEADFSLNREHLELWLFEAKGGKTLKTDLSFLPNLSCLDGNFPSGFSSAHWWMAVSTPHSPPGLPGEQPCFCHGLRGSSCASPGLPQPPAKSPAFFRGTASPPHIMQSFCKVPLACPHLLESSPAPEGKQPWGASAEGSPLAVPTCGVPHQWGILRSRYGKPSGSVPNRQRVCEVGSRAPLMMAATHGAKVVQGKVR